MRTRKCAGFTRIPTNTGCVVLDTWSVLSQWSSALTHRLSEYYSFHTLLNRHDNRLSNVVENYILQNILPGSLWISTKKRGLELLTERRLLLNRSGYNLFRNRTFRRRSRFDFLGAWWRCSELFWGHTPIPASLAIARPASTVACGNGGGGITWFGVSTTGGDSGDCSIISSGSIWRRNSTAFLSSVNSSMNNTEYALVDLNRASASSDLTKSSPIRSPYPLSNKFSKVLSICSTSCVSMRRSNSLLNPSSLTSIFSHSA